MTTKPVSIVGAGPGASDLLTVRALRRLRSAQVVFHDGLVPQSVVRLARRARHHRVSRRPGDARVSPAEVVARIIEVHADGQRVVRLRAGDPFVLARGAEEALGLIAAGVPIEIVPGLTSATTAAGLAGIPLTHRGITSAFLVVSGHDSDAASALLASIPAASTTIVVLMGLAQRARLAHVLVAAGWRDQTPVAIIWQSSRPDERIWRGTLATLGAAPDHAGTGPAGVIVIGEVAGFQLHTASDSRKEQPWLP